MRISLLLLCARVFPQFRASSVMLLFLKNSMHSQSLQTTTIRATTCILPRLIFSGSALWIFLISVTYFTPTKKKKNLFNLHRGSLSVQNTLAHVACILSLLWMCCRSIIFQMFVMFILYCQTWIKIHSMPITTKIIRSLVEPQRCPFLCLLDHNYSMPTHINYRIITIKRFKSKEYINCWLHLHIKFKPRVIYRKMSLTWCLDMIQNPKV